MIRHETIDVAPQRRAGECLTALVRLTAVVSVFLVVAAVFSMWETTRQADLSCQGVVCANGGTCGGGRCTCLTGFSGVACEDAHCLPNLGNVFTNQTLLNNYGPLPTLVLPVTRYEAWLVSTNSLVLFNSLTTTILATWHSGIANAIMSPATNAITAPATNNSYFVVAPDCTTFCLVVMRNGVHTYNLTRAQIQTNCSITDLIQVTLAGINPQGQTFLIISRTDEILFLPTYYLLLWPTGFASGTCVTTTIQGQGQEGNTFRFAYASTSNVVYMTRVSLGTIVYSFVPSNNIFPSQFSIITGAPVYTSVGLYAIASISADDTTLTVCQSYVNWTTTGVQPYNLYHGLYITRYDVNATLLNQSFVPDLPLLYLDRAGAFTGHDSIYLVDSVHLARRTCTSGNTAGC